MASKAVRILVALAGAALVPPIVFTTNLLYNDLVVNKDRLHLYGSGQDPTYVGSVFSIFLIYVCVTAVPALFMGLPAFFALESAKMVRWWTSVLTGLAIGFATYEVFSPLSHGIAPTLLGLILIDYSAAFECSLLGGVSALVAWIFWRVTEWPTPLTPQPGNGDQP